MDRAEQQRVDARVVGEPAQRELDERLGDRRSHCTTWRANAKYVKGGAITRRNVLKLC